MEGQENEGCSCQGDNVKWIHCVMFMKLAGWNGGDPIWDTDYFMQVTVSDGFGPIASQLPCHWLSMNLEAFIDPLSDMKSDLAPSMTKFQGHIPWSFS